MTLPQPQAGAVALPTLADLEMTGGPKAGLSIGWEQSWAAHKVAACP